jgi:hypothetical protein
MGFITEPEMSQSGCDVSTTFTTPMVLNMFNQDHAAYANTFLNPEMYYNFQTSYEAADWDTISSTYSLDQEQSKCMIRWVAQQTAFNSEQSIGNMMTATIARSMQKIRLLLPNWLSTSNMAYMLSQNTPTLPNTDWCQEFMGIGLGDQTLANTWCLNNPTNFTDVTTLTTWVDGTWYGAEMTQTVQDVTDMDSAQIAAFYDFTTVGSFGNWLQ